MAKRRKKFEFPEDRPMTEAEWEQMMKESDVRAARFGELLETFHGEPDADKKVAREMGYHELADDLEEYDRAKAAGEIEESDLKDEIDPEIDDFLAEREEELEKIPAYQMAMRVGEVVADKLKPYLEGSSKYDEDLARLIADAWIGIHITAAKISGGHAMGYEDESIGGNIVNNKRGLEGAMQAINGLKELRGKKIIPDKLIDELLPQMQEVADAVQSRIEELRKQIWWGDSTEKDEG